MCFLDPQVIHESGDVRDHLKAVRVIFPWLAGMSVASHIEGNDEVGCRVSLAASDCYTLTDFLLDARGNAQIIAEFILADPERLEKLVVQDLARVY